MTCSQCGRPHDVAAKFCRGCGAPVEQRVDTGTACAACDAPLQPGARFCKQCGASALPAGKPEPSAPAASVPSESPRPAVQAGAQTEPTASRRAASGPRGVVIAAAVVLGVVTVGGSVTWALLRDGTRTAATSTPAPQAAQPALPATAEPVAEAPKATAQAPAVTEAAPAPAALPPPPEPPASRPVVSAPDTVATPRAAQLPAEQPVRAIRAPVRSAPPAPMQDVALSLVRKGESAFSRQDYSTAIANARAALDVSPGLARAKQLLDEAQQAQQQAMSNISIQ